MVPVYFVLTRGIVLLDVAGPAEAFRVANKLIPGAFEQHFCGPSREVESGLPGLHLAHIQALPAALPPEALVIISGVVGSPRAWMTPTRAPSSTGWPSAIPRTASR